ncbi:alpha/beta-hydrolase [Gonapodya prolifera JEL478]|uniref:Alpha/beta-hydrolase n=1 Tax=Gonapodya prolifera (strain JEL478) TaxID=1344416 RepID=A0A139AP95_GONPJ|nr:alpha/beta-hydrolase [Gonapodya prolifera JEL478]|eukprot:KXS18552.1 alpha/beta-hydrolase [Gonapodya prolifera JEL478]
MLISECSGGGDHQRAKWIQTLVNGLPFDTCTLDARGMGESDGLSTYSNHYEETEDTKAVMDHLAKEYGLWTLCLIGHSKGAGSTLLLAEKYPHLFPPLVIFLNSLYFLNGRPERLADRTFSKWQLWNDVRTKGPQEQSKYRHKGKILPYIVVKQDLDIRETMDLDAAARRVPPHVRVLNITGEKDPIAPPEDVREWDTPFLATSSVAGRNTMAVLKGVAHTYREKAEQDALTKECRDWLLKWAPVVALERKKQGLPVGFLNGGGRGGASKVSRL